MHTMKFGGSSVGTPARVLQVMDIISAAHRKHRNLVVVLSAFQGVTDHLIAVSRLASSGDRKYHSSLRSLKKRHLDAVAELVPARGRTHTLASVRDRLDELTDVLHGVFFTRELTLRTLDYIMSFGEILSSYILAEAFIRRGIACTFTDSRHLIKTDDTFGSAHVKYDLTYRGMRTYFRKHPGLHIVPGFIASTTDNDTTTLGRGGSDFTASLYGAALRAGEVEIWTDVDGVMTADPRKVKTAFSILRMTYEEAMEMSHFGAKVIHPPTIQPALDTDIPVRIKNTFNPAFPGTVIGSRNGGDAFSIRGISSIDEIAILRIQGGGLIGGTGIGQRIFAALAARNINVILTSQASSEYSVCLAVVPHQAAAAKQAIEEEFRYEIRDRLVNEVRIEPRLSVVAIVGENMRNVPGISGRLFRSLGKNGINVVAIAQGSSELNISTVVAKEDEAKALNVIHEAFFLSGTLSLNLFIVGTGLIGSTLLQQIAHQKQALLNGRNIDLRIQAVGNSSHMLLSDQGIPPHAAQQRLAQDGTRMRLEEFVHRMKEMNLPNSVFVDCTASDAVVKKYAEILTSSISIVTPNKKANAGPLDAYRELRRLALKSNVRFLYSANVGAGLPILSTIDDLVAGGDRILRIEGALSGTLSYIFNSFTGKAHWSAIVEEAREHGYTEPDPREDLNGMDVGRKLLILAREAGHYINRNDISIEPVVPRAMLQGGSVGTFMKRLHSLDKHFESMREKAARMGRVPRYLATWHNGQAYVGLRDVPRDHPAASLTGSSVTVALTTANRKEYPIVISGPGAGAEVTASAVLADIIRIGQGLD
jgi:bifunctional aspartokinase / homoserine dehydrogenase 1